MQTFGVGMVGFGFIGKVHSHAHLSLPLLYDPLPARTRLVGVCTTSEGSGRKAQEQAGFEFATTDYQALLERDDIHLIHICTPNDAHYTVIMDALRAGKHIYCDKPLALNVVQAEEICTLARTVPTVQQMTFNYRFVPATMRARQLMEQGFLGDLFQFRAAYLHAGYISPERPFSWRTDMARSGGGAIADLGAHAIDLVRYLVGPGVHVGRAGEFAALRAELQTVIPERRDPRTGAMRIVDVDDIAYAQCRLQGGATGALEASRLATGVQDELRLELHGSQGGLKFNLMEPNWLDVYDATKPEAPLGGDRGYTRIEAVTRYPKPYALGATKNTVGWLNFHIQSLFDFVANVARHAEGEPMAPHSPTFTDGLAAQRVITACQQSSAQDSEVAVANS
ncbi:MAG TPA: Gfo/Idh/MocA family oxidoreductase [Chthonomonadaceae bacterium]|nr:Gfo/Idh/MocA family oxidoreductase [Chthonomonadaceae bacterium]